eukprot:c53252_g1_i1 orf=367-528(+)
MSNANISFYPPVFLSGICFMSLISFHDMAPSAYSIFYVTEISIARIKVNSVLP